MLWVFLLFCSRVLTNVQRSSKSPFSAVSSMKNAALSPHSSFSWLTRAWYPHRLPAEPQLCKPAAGRAPLPLLKTPRMPVAAGWVPVLSRWRGYAGANHVPAAVCASAALLPLGSDGGALKYPHFATDTCSSRISEVFYEGGLIR